MTTQADNFADINRKQRQRIMQLKSRAQKIYNKPSPITSNGVTPDISYTYSNSIKFSSKANTLDLLKEYQSNKTSSQQDQSSLGGIGTGLGGMSINLNLGAEKSVDYNSTLFKMLKQQSHIIDKQSEMMGNASSVSQSQGVTQNLYNNSQLSKDDSLLNQIDELLKKNQTKSKEGTKNINNQYVEKKSLTNSQIFSNNNSSMNSSNNYTSKQVSFNQQNIVKSITPGAYLKKLKTIQQQKATLTIDRQEVDDKKRQLPKQKHSEKRQKQKNSIEPVTTIINKKPPIAPPLSSLNSIQRQKKKIQETMYELKKEQNDYHDKDSLILQFSDNQSQNEKYEQRKIAKVEEQKNIENKQNKQKQQRKSILIDEKKKLTQQLELIQKQLQQLQRQQQDQSEEQI